MREGSMREAELWMFLETYRSIKEPGWLKQKERGKEWEPVLIDHERHTTEASELSLYGPFQDHKGL